MSQGIAIFISGGGSNMKALVEDMQGDHPARPCVVLSNRADAGGLRWAQGQGIATKVVDHRPFGTSRTAFEAALQEAVSAYAPDVICLAGFMRVLSADFVAPWQGRMLNIHPSLLPKYKGLNTHVRALEAKETHHGCTVHEVTAALDDGPIWGQAEVKIAPQDTPETLAARVLEQEHRLYPAVLRRFCAGDKRPVWIKAGEPR